MEQAESFPQFSQMRTESKHASSFRAALRRAWAERSRTPSPDAIAIPSSTARTSPFHRYVDVNKSTLPDKHVPMMNGTAERKPRSAGIRSCVTVTDTFKSCAWRGVLESMRRDPAVPSYACSIMEMLLEGRRQLHDSQLGIADELAAIRQKLDALSSQGETASQRTAGGSHNNSMELSSPILDYFSHDNDEEDSGDQVIVDDVPAGGASSARGEGDEDFLDMMDNDERESTRALDVAAAYSSDHWTPPHATRSHRIARFSNSRPSAGGGRVRFIPTSPPTVYNVRRPKTLSPVKRELPMQSIPSTAAGRSESGKSLSYYRSLRLAQRKKMNEESRRGRRPMMPTRLYVCRFCNKFESMLAEELFEHSEQHHSSRGQFLCCVCGSKAHNRCRLRAHLNQHTGEKPHACAQCGAAYSRHDVLVAHLRKCNIHRAIKMEPRDMDEELAAIVGSKGHERSVDHSLLQDDGEVGAEETVRETRRRHDSSECKQDIDVTDN